MALALAKVSMFFFRLRGAIRAKEHTRMKGRKYWLTWKWKTTQSMANDTAVCIYTQSQLLVHDFTAQITDDDDVSNQGTVHHAHHANWWKSINNYQGTSKYTSIPEWFSQHFQNTPCLSIVKVKSNWKTNTNKGIHRSFGADEHRLVIRIPKPLL